MSVRLRALIALVLVGVVSCSPQAQPDLSGGEPVVDRRGEVVGTADPDDVRRAIEGGEPAEVYSDGRLVGHFGEDGFEPTEGPGS